jgi:hypothetical protein
MRGSNQESPETGGLFSAQLYVGLIRLAKVAARNEEASCFFFFFLPALLFASSPSSPVLCSIED